MSEMEIQQLIDAILSVPAEAPPPGAVHTPDGQLAEQMRQQALLQLTRHPQAAMRQQAVEMLGESHQPAALAALLRLAVDSESEIRQQALSSLGGFEDEAATVALLEALQDSDYLVRATAAELLGGRKDAGIDELLMRCLTDEDSMVRATVAEALGRREAFLAAPALRDLLIDFDQWVRYSAAESLGQIEPEEEIWPLLMNANSAELAMRLDAIAQLGELRDRRAIPSLLKMLHDDTQLEAAVLNALEKFHDPLTVPALVELALFTEAPHLREQALIQAQTLSLEGTLEALASWLEPDRPQFAQRAIEALHQLPTADTTPLFLYAVQHPDRWVCTVALITLEQRRVPVPADHLLPLLDENIHDLVRAALKNLMCHAPEQVAESIEKFIGSELEWHRLAVAENLAHLSLERMRELATRLLTDDSDEVREAVLRSLASRATHEDTELLLTGSRDRDAWVRQAAVEGLGRLNLPQARHRLLEQLKQDEDFLVRAAAAEALSDHHDEDVRRALTQALDDAKSSVRLQVTHALFAQEIVPSREVLIRLLADQDKSVVLATLEQLRRILEPELRHQIQSQLEPLLAAEDPQIRSAAAALG